MSPTALAQIDRTATRPYRFDGMYLPTEVSAYLRAALPSHLQRERPPTARRIQRWITGGLVAPERRETPGRELVINFEDLVTCQVITLFREAGLSVQKIRTAEEYFTEHFDLAKPFAHRVFWYSPSDILGRLRDDLFVSGVRQGQLGWRFVIDGMASLRVKLGFAPDSGMANVWEPELRVELRPTIQFGQPCIKGTRIPTASIWGYVVGGDPVPYIAEAYGLEVTDVERAIAWENRVRAVVEPEPAVPA